MLVDESAKGLQSDLKPRAVSAVEVAEADKRVK